MYLIAVPFNDSEVPYVTLAILYDFGIELTPFYPIRRHFLCTYPPNTTHAFCLGLGTIKTLFCSDWDFAAGVDDCRPRQRVALIGYKVSSHSFDILITSLTAIVIIINYQF